jgi:hypothetical protein
MADPQRLPTASAHSERPSTRGARCHKKAAFLYTERLDGKPPDVVEQHPNLVDFVVPWVENGLSYSEELENARELLQREKAGPLRRRERPHQVAPGGNRGAYLQSDREGESSRVATESGCGFDRTDGQVRCGCGQAARVGRRPSRSSRLQRYRRGTLQEPPRGVGQAVTEPAINHHRPGVSC